LRDSLRAAIQFEKEDFMAAPKYQDLAKQKLDAVNSADTIIKLAEEQKRNMTAEESKKVDEFLAVVDSCKVQMREIEKVNVVHSSLPGKSLLSSALGYREFPNNPSTPRAAFKPSPIIARTNEHREQLTEIGAYLSGKLPISAVSTVTVAGDGAILVPEFVQQQAEINALAEDAVRNAGAFRLNTDSGAPIKWPVFSDSESGEQLGELSSIGNAVNPTELDGPTLNAYKISSKPIYLGRELETDSVPNVVGNLIDVLTRRVIRFENDRFTNGDGSAKAEGFLHACTEFEIASVTLDSLLDLAYSVPVNYRAGGAYMMSDSTVKYLRTIKTGISGDKRILWADADQTKGTPPTLHGYPVYVNNAMDDIASNGTFIGGEIAFGNFSKFIIRAADQGQLYILRFPAYTVDGTGIIVLRRTDSKLLVPEAISKIAVQGS
jgi:HK97 family phage major capsid protein